MAFSFFMKKRPVSDKPAPVKIQRKPEIVEKAPDHPTPVLQVDGKAVYAFIDASNLFWGGQESLGFRINYSLLIEAMRKKYNVSKAFYYGGARIFDYEYSILDNKPMDLAKLMEYLLALKEKSEANEAELIEKSIKKIHFYQLLESYGYTMRIKPAKVFYDEDDEKQERPILKANCDVDMTFDMMRYMSQYSGIVAMTGDGDFAAALNYLKNQNRHVTVISRWDRTAKEIRQLADDSFVDLSHFYRQIRR